MIRIEETRPTPLLVEVFVWDDKDQVAPGPYQRPPLLEGRGHVPHVLEAMGAVDCIVGSDRTLTCDPLRVPVLEIEGFRVGDDEVRAATDVDDSPAQESLLEFRTSDRPCLGCFPAHSTSVAGGIQVAAGLRATAGRPGGTHLGYLCPQTSSRFMDRSTRVPMRQQVCLITGGCGFVGRHLVARLAARHRNLFIVDDLSTGQHPALWLRGYVRSQHSDLEVFT